MRLGLDIGTSGVKAVLVSPEHQVIGQASAGLSVSRLASGHAEQSPQSWLDACVQCMDELHAHYPQFRDLRAIGLSGQMHGATLIDDQDQVIRDCMLWNDTRAWREAGALNQYPQVHQRSANWIFPGFTSPKLNWLRTHEPASFERIHKVLLPKDYVRLFLSGEYLTDLSDASGTGWLDVSQRRFSKTLLAHSGLELQHMPGCVEGSDPAGQLRDALAQRWGLNHPVMIAGGAGDNAATACGLGITQPGQGFVSLGTSGVLFTPTERCLPAVEQAVHAFCHALPQSWHHMGVTLSAADSLSWWCGILGVTPAQALAQLPASLDGPTTVKFLPYLGGERTPHNDSQIRGQFAQLEQATSQADMTQAVLQGVAFSLLDCLQALTQAGSQVDRLIAAGGGSASGLWLQMLADVLQREICVPQESGSIAALGAASLAARAIGEFEPTRSPSITQTYVPNPALAEAYARAHLDYQALYHNNKRDIG